MSKKELFEYLDWYHFVDESEVYDAVLDYFAEYWEIFYPSWWEVFYASKIADEYMQDRKITFNN